MMVNPLPHPWLSSRLAWADPLPLLGLTPVEKWQAARGISSQELISGQWFTLILLTLLVVMIVLLIKVTLNRHTENKKHAGESFTQNIRRHHLSVHEYNLLMEIIEASGVKHPNKIFKSREVFDRGVNRLLASIDRSDLAALERAQAEMEFLRDKLGVHLENGAPAEDEGKTKGKKRRLTSRDLPLGKDLYITRRLHKKEDDLQGTIVDNTHDQLIISIEQPIKINFGEVWRARYYFGASVWEFETTVVSYDGNRLIINHCNDIRFINRRRFVRVPTHCRAYVMAFPFSQILAPEMSETWQPSELTPATITELAGPGLRVETDLKAHVGDRLLVVAIMEPNKSQLNTPQAPAYIIQEVGQVRRVEPIFDRFAISIELRGLNDSDIDLLVRLTNQAALLANQIPAAPEVSSYESAEQVEQDAVLEAVIDQTEGSNG